MVGGMEVGKVPIMEVLHVTITPSESATHECTTICLGWRVKRSFCDTCILAEFLKMLVFDNTSNVDIRVALDTWKHKHVIVLTQQTRKSTRDRITNRRATRLLCS
jgi:hypothetical protein